MKKFPLNRFCLRFPAVAAACLPLLPLAAAETPVVAVVPVTRGEIYREVAFDAEMRPYQEIELHARATGYLDEILVDAGDVVKEGQPIAALDVPELAIDLENAQASARRARADVERARAAHEEAELTLTRLTGADKAQPNLIARQDLDSARLKEQSAKASLDAAMEEINVAEASARRFQTMLDYTHIVAPFAGVITRRYVDPGALIQAGTSSGSHPLVRLSQTNRLRVAFPVSVSYVSQVKAGDEAEVRVPSLDRSFRAKISRISQKVETATRTMEAQVDLDNEDGSLVAGVYAVVVLKLNRNPEALVLPVEAVARDKSNATVFLVSQEGKLEFRNISVGTESPVRLEVAQGLAEGDLVMVGSRAQFSNGQQVQPKQVELPKHD